MDLLKPFIARWTWDFYLKRDGYELAPFRKQLAASQYLSVDELRALQLRHMQQLLSFAYQSNAFYRQRFDACGFKPGDLKELEDIAALPILTKEDIRCGLGRTFSQGYNQENSMHKRTGGSTGVPLHVYWDVCATNVKKAATERHNAWAGLVPGQRIAAVWGDTDKPQPWKTLLRNALTSREFFLDTLKFDLPHLDKFLSQIRKYQPQVMMGHAHSIFKLAEYVRDHAAGSFHFKGIITTAMVLSPTERATIEEVFQSPVYDRYGCEELSIIASECEAHTGLHIFAEGLWVEIVGQSGAIPGKLIITDLVNYAMPMIRYEIGDYAVPAVGVCPCGRNLPRLQEVSGRTADFLYTPDRIPVFGISILDTFVIHIPGFRQVQIIQDRYDHLDFFIVKDSSYSEKSMTVLRENVVQIFGNHMTYDVHFVHTIPQSESGKYRFSICKINQNNDR